MRTVVSILVIFALAAGLVIAERYNTGYALLVLPPYRIEISLILLLALLFVAFLVFHSLLQLVSGTLRLPSRVREYRSARRRQKTQATLLEALQEFFAGRYARAEKAAASLIEREDHAALCAILAARAAHGLRAFARRDAYLAQAATLAAGDDAMRVVTAAELLLDERRHRDALDVLKALPAKHTAALRLELKAQQLAKNWEQVLSLVDQLEKRKVFDADQADEIRCLTRAENLRRKGNDARAVEEAWKAVPSRQKKDKRVAAAAAQAFSALGAFAQAQRIIEDALEADWDGALLELYAESGDDALRRIERAEAWLAQRPHDATLLRVLGKLCARQELWGKAQSYLEASIGIEPTYGAHLALAKLQESLGNVEGAGRHYRRSLELAIAQLTETRGGATTSPRAEP